MPTRTPSKWGGVSMFFHWLIALLIVTLATVGLIMVDMTNSPTKISVFQLHKSIGITVLALAALRLVWRLAHRAPAPVAGTPRWQHLAASGTHAALYAMMFVMPISGWLFNSAANFPLKWFGLVKLPALWGPDRVVKAWALDVHVYGFYVLAVLVLAHVGAALWHHSFKKDETLVRMLPEGWVADPSAPSEPPGRTTS
jgi:cytochrome b561